MAKENNYCREEEYPLYLDNEITGKLFLEKEIINIATNINLHNNIINNNHIIYSHPPIRNNIGFGFGFFGAAMMNGDIDNVYLQSYVQPVPLSMGSNYVQPINLNNQNTNYNNNYNCSYNSNNTNLSPNSYKNNNTIPNERIKSVGSHIVNDNISNNYNNFNNKIYTNQAEGLPINLNNNENNYGGYLPPDQYLKMKAKEDKNNNKDINTYNQKINYSNNYETKTTYNKVNF